MFKNFLSAGWVLLLVTSCKTIAIDQVSQTNTTQQVVLGSIGLEKDFILQSEFNNTSIPAYKTPIKVSTIVTPFTKQTLRVFAKANVLQAANVNVNYVDSIKTKPNYVKLQIADKVAVIHALNNEENTAVKKYLSYNADVHIITSISIALNQPDLDAITKADAVFLVEKGYKTYALQLYKDAVKTQTIPFNQGVVFAFKGSNCCWQANKYHKLEIVDLVSDYNSCPNNTYRSAKRSEKKIHTLNY